MRGTDLAEQILKHKNTIAGILECIYEDVHPYLELPYIIPPIHELRKSHYPIIRSIMNDDWYGWDGLIAITIPQFIYHMQELAAGIVQLQEVEEEDTANIAGYFMNPDDIDYDYKFYVVSGENMQLVNQVLEILARLNYNDIEGQDMQYYQTGPAEFIILCYNRPYYTQEEDWWWIWDEYERIITTYRKSKDV